MSFWRWGAPTALCRPIRFGVLFTKQKLESFDIFTRMGIPDTNHHYGTLTHVLYGGYISSRKMIISHDECDVCCGYQTETIPKPRTINPTTFIESP